MKKTTLILALILFSAVGAFAQLENPVTCLMWQKNQQTEAVVYLKASIDDSWHIYSQNIKAGGPSKTIFTYSPSKDYSLVAKTVEPKPISKFEKVFNMDVAYFEDQVVFQQKVKLNKGVTTIKGKVEYMVCNDKSCLPPTEVKFSIPVK